MRDVSRLPHMQFIVEDPDGGWNLQPYFEYLLRVKHRLPPEVFAFAADSRNYDLTSHQSLHDAWLENLSISEPATGERSEVRGIQIDCRLLGPYHDFDICLSYRGVRDYNLVSPAAIDGPPSIGIGHGDLLMHEVRLADDDRAITHELHFSRGSVLQITCATFSHSVRPRSH